MKTSPKIKRLSIFGGSWIPAKPDKQVVLPNSETSRTYCFGVRLNVVPAITICTLGSEDVTLQLGNTASPFTITAPSFWLSALIFASGPAINEVPVSQIAWQGPPVHQLRLVWESLKSETLNCQYVSDVRLAKVNDPV